MFINHIFSRIKSLFLTIFAVIRRAFCCFSRKRKPSYADCEILTSVNVDHSTYSNSKRHNDVKIQIFIWSKLVLMQIKYLIGWSWLEFMGRFTSNSRRTYWAISTTIGTTKNDGKQRAGSRLFSSKSIKIIVKTVNLFQLKYVIHIF